VAEQLDRDRVLLRVDAKQLADRALVAVVEPEARDHLRNREPGTLAASLEAHEPVADPGQGSQQHAIGDRDVADPERGCQRWLNQRFLS